MTEYYRGSQWAVTDYGIEQISDHEGNTPYYHIGIDQLDQAMGEDGWVGHMSEKNWVDIPDFRRAYDIARKIHLK